MSKRIKFCILAAAYLGTIVAANATLARFGLIGIGFGLVAPAGVFWAGLSFGLRDAIQELGGRWVTLPLIAVGAGLSWFIEPKFAVASGVAFAFGELADWSVYTPLRERRWVVAAVLSSIVGAAIDSALFLHLAFGEVTGPGVLGLIVGKVYVIPPTLLAIKWARSR